MHRVSHRPSLLIRKLGEETLVYDLETHRASCLNREAAAVFEACDGQRSLAEIQQQVARTLGTPLQDWCVELAIDRLSRSGLLDDGTSPPSAPRREVLRRLAAAAAFSLPVVMTVVAPDTAAAQSCLPTGTACPMAGSATCCTMACTMGKGSKCT